jgi:DNA-binding MarR family transcriptional regulator
MAEDPRVRNLVRALRRVNLEASLFGQTVAVRFGLSDSDVDALETLIDRGAATAGRLGELLGMTTGAVTRMIDRLEQAGFVRRVPDPGDRRRVIVEVVPEKAAAIEQMLGRIAEAGSAEIGRYSEAQLELIRDFLDKMAAIARTEASRLRERPVDEPSSPLTGDHAAPLGDLAAARLAFRSGAADLTLRSHAGGTDLYRAHFTGQVPTVRLRDGIVSVQYRGLPFDWRRRTAELSLSKAVAWSIELHGGGSKVTAELGELELTSFELSGGVARLRLRLGAPRRDVPVLLTGGADQVVLTRPQGVPVRLTVSGGAAQVEVDGARLGAHGGEMRFESPGVDAANHYAVELTGGVNKLTIQEAGA